MGYEFDFGLVLTLLPFLLKGVQFTVLISVFAFAIAVILGMLIAMLRLTGLRVFDAPLSLYVDIFRSLPHLVALFWFFYAIPILTGFQPPAVTSASIALGIAVSAGMSEVFRGGILSLTRGQWEASFALGMTTLQAYRRIIFPQAIVRMLPPVGSFAISIVKASALASIIGVGELMWQANAMLLWTYRRVEVYTVVAVVYFVLTYPLAILINFVHKRFLPEE